MVLSVGKRDKYWVVIMIMIIIMIYTAAFPQSGSSSAGIRVISACNILRPPTPGRFPYPFREVLWVLPLYWVSRDWKTR